MSASILVDLCAVDELEVGGRRRFELESGPVCLVRVGDGYRAISDICSHEDFPLSEGEVDLEDCLIECWKHGSMFSLDTGQPMSFPATQPVRVYEVVVDAGRVAVRI
jgi:3-phenylpropionate/trans-cinnamate dioxygenase ferredoxin subunit